MVGVFFSTRSVLVKKSIVHTPSEGASQASTVGRNIVFSQVVFSPTQKRYIQVHNSYIMHSTQQPFSANFRESRVMRGVILHRQLVFGVLICLFVPHVNDVPPGRHRFWIDARGNNAEL